MFLVHIALKSTDSIMFCLPRVSTDTKGSISLGCRDIALLLTLASLELSLCVCTVYQMRRVYVLGPLVCARASGMVRSGIFVLQAHSRIALCTAFRNASALHHSTEAFDLHGSVELVKVVDHTCSTWLFIVTM